MALQTQMVDVPLTQGVDSKMTANTTLDQKFTAITNMRADYIGGYLPRAGFTKSVSGTFATPAWCASNPINSFYSSGRTVTGDLSSSNLQAASGLLRRRAFGSQLDTDPSFIAAGVQSNKILTAWVYAAATAGPQLSYAWYDPILDANTYGGSVNVALTEIQVTSGASNAYIWGISGAGALACYSVGVSGAASALTVSNGGITITRFDVVYNAANTTWYMIYVQGVDTKIVKYTLSGTTMTAGTPTTLGAAAQNVAIAMVAGSGGTTYAGVGYYISAVPAVTGALINTSTLATVSTVDGATPAAGVSNIGVCDSLSANPLMVTYTRYTSSFLPKIGGFTVSTSSTASAYGETDTPFGAISKPVALATSGVYSPYVAGTDMTNVATYATAGLGQVSSSGLTMGYRWSANSAVGIQMHRGINIVSVGARYCIPQVWEGRTEELTVATAGFGSISTQQVAGLVVVDETASCASSYFPFGTAQIISAGNPYGVDSLNIGPSGAFPIPAILSSTLVASNGAGTLTSNGRYSYRLLKRWSDSLGNVMECVSPPFALTLGATDDTVTFTIPAQAFLLSQLAPSNSANVQIKVYRTEADGGVHYFIPTRSYFATATLTDTTPDTGLDLTDALTYDGGELEDRELSHIKHMTSWQGRLVALTSDSDTKVFYSKPQENYRGVRFADGLEIDFPQAKGGLVGLAGMDYTLYALAKNEIYTISGALAGATGENGSLGDPELRFNGIGCVSTKSILTSTKGIAFQSEKGMYMILRNQELTFIGEGPFADRATTIVGAYVDATRPELHYILSTGTEWVYNWDQNLWTSFTLPATPLCASLQGSTAKFLATDGLWGVDSGSSEVIPLTMTTAWISLTGIQGYQRCRNIMLLLSYIASHTLTVTAYTDYNDTTPVQTWTISTATDVSTTVPYQLRLHLQNQKCEAVKLKITSTTAGWGISGISMEIGTKKDHYKPRTAANTF